MQEPGTGAAMLQRVDRGGGWGKQDDSNNIKGGNNIEA